MFGTKKKLMTAVVMLVISAIMMTSASYAWFTISTNPEITDMDVKVVVNENLEIALAKGAENGDSFVWTEVPAPTAVQTGNQYTWGNLIDLNVTNLDGQNNSGNYFVSNLDKTVRPASTVDNGSDGYSFSYPKYGSDGRVSAFGSSGDSITTVTLNSNGFGNIKGTDGKIYGYYVDFWMRSNKPGAVSLSINGLNRASDSSGVIDGAGSYFTSTNTNLKNSGRIAFTEISYTKNGNVISTPKTDLKAIASVAEDTGGTGLTVGTNSSGTTFSGTVVQFTTANQEKLIRMFVYIDGTNMTNADASITGTEVKGTLNVQFTHADTLKTMNDVG